MKRKHHNQEFWDGVVVGASALAMALAIMLAVLGQMGLLS